MSDRGQHALELDDAELFEGYPADQTDEEVQLAEFDAWIAEQYRAQSYRVSRISFEELDGWLFEQDTGNLVHHSGKFFSIEGLDVLTDRDWAGHWQQPIIVQPEVGILGILLKRIGGVPHLLMQAKMEPGNVNGVQLSPTVQATRSNYTGVHGGRSIPYLSHFLGPDRGQVVVDVLQSEQAAWYLHKRNRNMIVEVSGPVEEREGFCWLTLQQVRKLLQRDHLVNMDSRTVLACMPPPTTSATTDPAGDSFGAMVCESLAGRRKPATSTADLLSWLTDIRTRRQLVQRRVPLRDTAEHGWRWSAEEITHVDGKYFTVLAVHVEAGNREVSTWSQPLIAPTEQGVVALLVKPINGVLHALIQARLGAGAVTVAELAPTVNCQPGNYRDVPEQARPAYLDQVLTAQPSQVRYDVLHTEEGGRFYQARNRYLIVETAPDFATAPGEHHRWVSLRQLSRLAQHYNYLNVELRSLMAGVHTLQ